MAKKKLTEKEREIHNRAVKIRKMSDESLVKLSEQALAAKLAEERAAVEEAKKPETINRVGEFLGELENGAVSGIGIAKIQKMREFAMKK